MSSTGWQGAVTVALAALVVVLAVWLPVTAARRWVPARWRAVAASLGSALVLLLGGGVAVLSVTALAT